MNAQTTFSIDPNSLAAFSKSAGEPEWMTAKRKQALELASSLGLPKLEKTRIDLWNMDRYGEFKSSAPIADPADLPASARELLGEGEPANLLVQCNSSAVLNRLSEQLAQQGVIFTDLQTALRTHGDLVERYFMKAVAADEHRLTAMHAALWNGGVFLYVPKNVQIEMPLQAMFIRDDADAAFAPHVLIVAEANSSVTYVENYLSDGTASGSDTVASNVVEVFVQAGASVRFASVRNMDDRIVDVCYRRAVVENDGNIEWIIGELNNGNAVSETTSLLKGNGSAADTKKVVIGANQQRMNVTTRTVHFGRSSTSNMETRAVLRDEATAIVNGITKIEKGATNANGEQTEKLMMLSTRARGDANPILLIDEDEVKAGHAASVGQIDPEHIHYMMTRGVTREEATRLIIYGFLAPIVSEVPLENVEAQLKALVERKLSR